jgi:hypothetical protein
VAQKGSKKLPCCLVEWISVHTSGTPIHCCLHPFEVSHQSSVYNLQEKCYQRDVEEP